jgi:putative resolvase
MAYLSIREAAEYLGVSQPTLRRWDKAGKLVAKRTLGNHRRYSRQQLDEVYGTYEPMKKRGRKPKKDSDSGVPYLYARVSGYQQKKDGNLDRQIGHLKKYARKHYGRNVKYVIISEYGSGLNMNRKGLKRLIQAVKTGKCSSVIVHFKDRLTRFGFDFLQSMFYDYKVGIQVAELGDDITIYERMVNDILAVMTCFSEKFYKGRTLQLTEGEREEKRLSKLENEFIEKAISRAWRVSCKNACIMV